MDLGACAAFGFVGPRRPQKTVEPLVTTRISSGSPFEKNYGYCRAVVDDHYVHISGTTGYDYETMAMPAEAAAQARNIFKTFANVLAQAGGALDDVIRLRVFVVAAEHCEPVLRVQGEIFADIRPAAAIYIVAGLLRPEMLVEIEATARRGR